MRRITRVTLATTMLGILVPCIAVAQGAGASGIAGAVRDTSSAVLPGVTVEAASPALIEKVRTVVTDAQGQYKIIDLRPGTYSVTFSLPGFGTIRREGLELPANFTASMNVELTVGGIEETVVVSGASPVVDVQNLTQQLRLTQEVLTTVPVSKTAYSLIALMPSTVSNPSNQDVGGSRGESSYTGSIHGSKPGDQHLHVDGMNINIVGGGGAGGSFYLNPGSAEAILVEVASGGSAEYAGAGINLNVIPKEGGNRFSGYFLANYGGGTLASDNLSAELRDRGLRQANKLIGVHDINASAGGPVSRDRLWFYTAFRHWGITQEPFDHYYNATPGTFLYTPDLSRPAQPIQTNRSVDVRLTWQISQKHKVGGYTDRRKNIDCPNHEISSGSTSTARSAPEAVFCLNRAPLSLSQAKWTYPATNRLLFDAGVSRFQYEWTRDLPPGASVADTSIVEQSTGLTYQAPPYWSGNNSSQGSFRFSTSYVTGSHHFKAGLFMMRGINTTTLNRAFGDVTYTFSNGAPISLTQYVNPTTTKQFLSPQLALFVQDQWTIDRLTLNGGLRFEYLRAYVPASNHPATLLVGARSFDQVNCVPCWKDLSPRFGVAYDVFGNARTALKASVGKYLVSELTGLASANDPVNTSVNNVNRAWTDTNRNFVPDCDLRNPADNGECRQIANLNFGQRNIATRYDPEVLNGWHKRIFDWQVSASVEHELRPGMAVSAGYFRTWYGNFRVTDNLEVTPEDYNHYCVTAPSDTRLPGGGGNQICGLYDITPSKFGRVNNLVTFASHYGKQTEVYNGVDFNVNLRLPRGAQLSGGLNVGNSLYRAGQASSYTNNCFVVDSPQQLYQCEVRPPYTQQFKVTGSYPLPWALQVSANFQSLPGAAIGARYNAPTAQILPSLGRNLAGGVRTAGLEVIAPFEQFEARISQIDVRLMRKFQLGRVRLQGMVDAYNALNTAAVLSSNPTYGSSWRDVTEILGGRLVRLGVQVEF